MYHLSRQFQGLIASIHSPSVSKVQQPSRRHITCFLTVALQEQESEGVDSSDKTALPQWDAKEEKDAGSIRRATRDTSLLVRLAKHPLARVSPDRVHA